MSRPVAAAGGLLGGLASALAGALLTAASWLAREPQGQAFMHKLGGGLLCLTVPLLLLGGACLDGLEKGAPSLRTTHGSAEADDDD